MKPFDLEKALSGEPVITRDGDKVTQLKKYTIRYREAIVGVRGNDNAVTTWNLNGNFYKSIENDSRDLFMADKPKKKYYLGIHIDAPPSKSNLYATSLLYDDKSKITLYPYYNKIIEIELEE